MASLAAAVRPARPALRWARTGVVRLAVLAAIALALALVGPMLAGWRTFTVLSGSMEPAIAVGDAIVVRPIEPADARVGDVVTFADPERPGRLLTHRVVRVREERAAVAFVTRGDANTGVERWSIARDGRMGRLAYRVPKAGWVLSAARTPAGRVGLVTVPAVLLGLLWLVRIWSRPARGSDHG